VVTPEGAVIVNPPPPTRSSTSPSPGCTRGSDGRGLALPPTPGIQAERVSRDSVVIRYSFATLPDDCEPAKLKLTADVNDDTLPGTGRFIDVDAERGEATIELPDALRKADVATASALTADGRSSSAAKVQIR